MFHSVETFTWVADCWFSLSSSVLVPKKAAITVTESRIWKMGRLLTYRYSHTSFFHEACGKQIGSRKQQKTLVRGNRDEGKCAVVCSGLHADLCVLFAAYLTTLLVAQTVGRKIIGWLMNLELERMWKKAVVSLFRVHSQHLLVGAEENLENVGISCLRGRYLGADPPEHRAGALSAWLWHSLPVAP